MEQGTNPFQYQERTGMLPLKTETIVEPPLIRTGEAIATRYPRLLQIGADAQAKGVLVKQIEIPEIGKDRVTVVALNSHAIDTSNILPKGYEVDPDHPVVFTDIPRDQSGYFYEPFAGIDLDDETKAKILEKVKLQNPTLGKPIDASDLQGITPDRLIEVLNDKTNDIHNIPEALLQWLIGSRVFVNNAGSRINRGEVLPVGLALKKIGEDVQPQDYQPQSTPLPKRIMKNIRSILGI